MLGGGKKPKELNGEFNGIGPAVEAVEAYLIKASYVHKRNVRRKAEEDSDGKKSDGTG